MTLRASIATVSPSSRFEHGHDQQRHDRERRELHRRGVGAGQAEVLVRRLHVLRQRLRPSCDAARDDAHGTELAERPRRRQHDAVRDGPADRGQRDPPEGRERRRAERRRGLLLLDADLAQHGHDLAHDERQRDEGRGEQHRRQREQDLDPVSEQPVPEPAVARVEQVEREPDDDRRERHRQVDDRVHEPHARNPVAHDRERAEDAERRVQRHGDHRDLEREAQRMRRVVVRDRRPEGVPAVLERPPEDEPDRRDEDQRQVAEREDADPVSRALLTVMAGGPAPEGADREQDAERDREQQHREGGGTRRVAAVDPLEDVERGDLRLEREVAGDEDHGAELADRARERERDSGQERRQQVRKDDAAEDREPVGAERGGGLLHLPVELDQHRLDGADDERQRHEQERHQHAPARVRDVDADAAGRAVEREQRQAGDDRRQRERQVDQRVDEPLAAEVVADERPGERGAGDRVDRDDRAGEPERQLERGPRLRVPRDLPEVVPAAVGALHDEGRERDEDDDAEVAEREPAAQRRSAEGASPRPRQPCDDVNQWTAPGSARSSRRCRSSGRRTGCSPCPSRRRT